ncbi:uncharacterized protein LOC108961920 isoform X7 [Serinus canaria]|uniref:uncharacterized protein LOC108961920 isoform X7 n=1 Tax=Serinus canaria TaxID=9135 RepID=UPI0021CCBE66|nr:uncharacterized protein LOC108961920 isoform X7 [Serinus canaria]
MFKGRNNTCTSRSVPSPQWGGFPEGDSWKHPKLDPISAVPAPREDSSLTSSSSENSCFAHPASPFFHAIASGSRVGCTSFHGEIQVLEVPHSMGRSRFWRCLIPWGDPGFSGASFHGEIQVLEVPHSMGDPGFGGASFHGEIQVLEVPHSMVTSRFWRCLIPWGDPGFGGASFHGEIQVLEVPHSMGRSRFWRCLIPWGDPGFGGASFHGEIQVLEVPHSMGRSRFWRCLIPWGDPGFGGASFHGEIQVLEVPHSMGRSRFWRCLIPWGDPGFGGASFHGEIQVLEVPHSMGRSRFQPPSPTPDFGQGFHLLHWWLLQGRARLGAEFHREGQTELPTANSLLRDDRTLMFPWE